MGKALAIQPEHILEGRADTFPTHFPISDRVQSPEGS